MAPQVAEVPVCARNPPWMPPVNEPSDGFDTVNCQLPVSVKGMGLLMGPLLLLPHAASIRVPASNKTAVQPREKFGERISRCVRVVVLHSITLRMIFRA